MESPDRDPLIQRVDRLERELAEIKRLVEWLAPGAIAPEQGEQRTSSVPAPTASLPPQENWSPPTPQFQVSPAPSPSPPPQVVPTPPPPPPVQAAPPRPDVPLPPPRIRLLQEPSPKNEDIGQKGFELPEHMRKMEYWLSRVGIALLLFGVAFAFKYSIEQGWITPPIRHFFGLGVGVVLLIMGLRLYTKRRHFAQVLLGGSIGTFYITGFSAFQLFQLIDHTVAFALLIAVTALAFFIAIKQDDALFSLIGTAGGLGTPFLLYTGEGNIPGLVGYTCLLLAGTTAVYFFKGWCLLMWLSVFGGWVVMLTGLSAAVFRTNLPRTRDQWAIQIGILFIWLCYWLVPLIRRIIHLRNPERRRMENLGIGDASLTPEGRAVFEQHLHVMAVGLPLAALGMSIQTWPGVSDSVFGWAAIGGALLYLFTGWTIRKTADLVHLAFTHAAVGTLLLTMALCLILDGDALLFALAGEAAVLHLLARRLSDRKISFGAHVLFAGVAVMLFLRLMDQDGPVNPVFNARALTDLWVLAVALATAFFVNKPVGFRIYFIGGVYALALLFNRELSGNILFFVLSMEALALFFAARWLKDDAVHAASHLAYVLMGGWLGDRLINQESVGASLFNYMSGADGLLIASFLLVWRLARTLPERQLYFLASAAAFAGLMCRELDGNLLMVVLTAEAAAIHLLSWRRSDVVIGAGGHVLTFGLGLWLGFRLLELPLAGPGLFNYRAGADALLITCGLLVWRIARTLPERQIYLLASAAAFAGLMCREFDGNLLLITLTAEVAILHWLAWRREEIAICLGAHILTASVGIWMLLRLKTPRELEPALINLNALTDLVTIGTALVISRIIAAGPGRLAYQLVAHLSILAWFARELSPLENGQGYVSAAWGVYGAILLVAGLRLSLVRMRQVALGTLLLVVAKLFLIDLAKLETIWRVLLFMGFGGVFLVLSYYFQKLWRDKPEESTPEK